MANILDTHEVSKAFGALVAVNRVSLGIEAEGIHSIIGPNGAGKTTFFNLLTGFLRPTSGKIFFLGEDITGRPPHRVSALGVGRSFQITSVFPELTVRENVRIALQRSTRASYRLLGSMKTLRYLEERAEQLLDQVALGAKGGLPAKAISHGERRILDIAVAMATSPRLLLLDEPASGLAGDEISRLVRLIQDLATSTVIVLVEHNIDLVLSVSRTIAVLHQGEVIAQGPPEAIRQDARVQEAYLGGEACF
ncbi:MAG: ABC transporter ATP-binding protein [Deferrisomatales bacterium]|nr:ABC transporter ATP-binding protein [Deferrisomatales bacterium]